VFRAILPLLVVILRRGVRAAWLLAESFTVAVAVEVALRRRSFNDVLTATSATRRRWRQPPHVHPATLERAIAIAYKLLPVESTCLKRSLVFCRIRRRWGLPVELRIGVQTADGVFGAHAWVEDGSGTALTDPLEGFNPMQLPHAPIRNVRASD
jgi:hypothetical protein